MLQPIIVNSYHIIPIGMFNNLELILWKILKNKCFLINVVFTRFSDCAAYNFFRWFFDDNCTSVTYVN